MTGSGAVRWGIIGTARIARTAFLPGLRRAGGVAAAVAGRDQERAERFARENGVQRGISGYQRLIDDPAVDALYIPLPNSLHAEWAIRALRAGKPVLCEKPLCATLAETERVLAVAAETGTLLWEAFVFPFRDQFSRVTGLLADGAIGELREIQSSFHFQLGRGGDIRLSSELGGGALNDVGCYPVRLALELLGAGFQSAWAAADFGGQEVDMETVGSLGFDGGRRLLLSCGLRRSYDTFTRLQGTTGQIHLTNPFHPGPADRFEVLAEGAEARSYQAAGDEPSFTAAIAHIQAVLRGEEAPRLLAAGTSLASARALHDLHASMAAG